MSNKENMPSHIFNKIYSISTNFLEQPESSASKKIDPKAKFAVVYTVQNPNKGVILRLELNRTKGMISLVPTGLIQGHATGLSATVNTTVAPENVKAAVAKNTILNLATGASNIREKMFFVLMYMTEKLANKK